MESLFDRLKTFCLEQGFDRTLWIAYSGGLDSHVLLHLTAALRNVCPLRLRAVHIHHGLSPNADAWAAHCLAVSAALNIDFVLKKIHVDAALPQSIEETARDARYAALKTVIDTGDILLTAHQQDDQAETVLLQLLRGAGPKGLAAMPTIKPFGLGVHGRPFLSVMRSELEEYAKLHALQWIDDESNQDVRFTRNFLRQMILPLLKQRWPNVSKTLARSAELCAETQMALDEHIASLLAVVRLEPAILSIPALLALSPSHQRHVLRAWLCDLQLPLPSVVKMRAIQNDFLSAANDRAPLINWHNVELRRYHHQLHVMPCLKPHDAEQVLSWDLAKPLHIPSLGTFFNPGLRLDLSPVTVRFRQGGEWCQLPGRKHRHSLKHLFQTWQVPPWLRNRIPLVYAGDRLVAVMGYFMDEAYLAEIPVVCTNGDLS